MGTDARGNAHVKAGVPRGGQFSSKLNAEPIPPLVDDQSEVARLVASSDLERGQLLIIGPQTVTRWENNQLVVLDGRETAEIVAVERFGRLVRLTLELQNGSQTTSYLEPDDPVTVSTSPFGKRVYATEQ